MDAYIGAAGEAKDTMARHPFHDVAIVGVHNTKQARVLEGHDSRSITFEAGLGALADAGLATARHRRRHRPVRGSDFVYQARIGPVWRSMSRHGHPRGARGRGRDRQRARHHRAHQRGIGGRLHRARVDRAVDAPAQRVRRAVRHVHRRRVRARSRAATCTCTARRPRRSPPSPPTIRNNGHVNPEAVLLRTRAVHRRRTSSTAAWSPTRSTSSTAR